MISKPEDAKPETLWDYENKFGDEPDGETMRAVMAFTHQQCAEIARAYANSLVNFNHPNDTTCSEWESKFTEWEKL